MRLYLKLFALITVFAGVGAAVRWAGVAEMAGDVRIALICQFGSAAQVEAMVDRLQRDRAAAIGDLDVYEAGKRFQQLRAARIAEAVASRGGPISNEEIIRIDQACARDAFGGGGDGGDGPDAPGERPNDNDLTPAQLALALPVNGH